LQQWSHRKTNKEQTMSQETNAPNAEEIQRKYTDLQRKYKQLQWASLGCTLMLIVNSLILIFHVIDPFPLATEKLEGTITILNENGETIPFRGPFIYTVYSRYAPGSFRSEASRKREYTTGESGRISVSMPHFPATLFFSTDDGKHAAVVDINPDELAAGLDVKLRPRFSATGRLVNSSGTPLANYEFSLDIWRETECPEPLTRPQRVEHETFEFVCCRTDADGFFAADRLIPGVEYDVRSYQPRPIWHSVALKMPILSPEQYQQPYDLGDVTVR
jgi:hypothetical protein